VKFCFGCRFLFEENKGDDLSTVEYNCRHFPNHGPIGIVSREEFDEPMRITRRCFRPKTKRAPTH
jgi:hypothetical protein